MYSGVHLIEWAFLLMFSSFSCRQCLKLIYRSAGTLSQSICLFQIGPVSSTQKYCTSAENCCSSISPNKEVQLFSTCPFKALPATCFFLTAQDGLTFLMRSPTQSWGPHSLPTAEPDTVGLLGGAGAVLMLPPGPPHNLTWIRG